MASSLDSMVILGARPARAMERSTWFKRLTNAPTVSLGLGNVNDGRHIFSPNKIPQKHAEERLA